MNIPDKYILLFNGLNVNYLVIKQKRGDSAINTKCVTVFETAQHKANRLAELNCYKEQKQIAIKDLVSLLNNEKPWNYALEIVDCLDAAILSEYLSNVREKYPSIMTEKDEKDLLNVDFKSVLRKKMSNNLEDKSKHGLRIYLGIWIRSCQRQSQDVTKKLDLLQETLSKLIEDSVF